MEIFLLLLKKKIFWVDSDEYIEDLKKYPEITHKYNTYILLNLVHPWLLWTVELMYSLNGGKGIFKKELESKAMTKKDILMVNDLFVKGALRAKKAGFDGVEIHSGHMTLLSSFISKLYNYRTD